jgi:hypothetical protein
MITVSVPQVTCRVTFGTETMIMTVAPPRHGPPPPAGFLRETSDGRLRELVRNPLLATITAVSAVKEPDRPLPASRIALYERFYEYLAGERSGKPNPLAQLRRHHEDNPELLACARWLHQSRSEILRALARHRMESQDKLWQAAVEWARDQMPDDVTLVDGWEDHLREELVGTGLLVGGERELRFLHQSFAEFLSAQSHAETIGDDFDELDTWIRQGQREAERTFALFTLAMWAARPGHDIGIVIDRLLSSLDPRRLLFAGRLMAEGVSVPDNMAVCVTDRLFAWVRNLGDSDSDFAGEGFEVLGALFDYPAVPARLDALAGDTNVLRAELGSPPSCTRRATGRRTATRWWRRSRPFYRTGFDGERIVVLGGRLANNGKHFFPKGDPQVNPLNLRVSQSRRQMLTMPSACQPQRSAKV